MHKWEGFINEWLFIDRPYYTPPLFLVWSFSHLKGVNLSISILEEEEGSHCSVDAYIFNVRHWPSDLLMRWAQNLSSSLILESKLSFSVGVGETHWFSMHFVQIFNLSCFYSPSELPLSHNKVPQFLRFLWIILAFSCYWWSVTVLFSVSSITFYPIPFSSFKVVWLLSSFLFSFSLWIYTLKNKNNSQYCYLRWFGERN